MQYERDGNFYDDAEDEETCSHGVSVSDECEECGEDEGGEMSEADKALKAGAEMGTLAAKLSVLVLGAYQRDDAAAMRAFGSNAAAHVANDLARALIRFKALYQGEQ